MTTAREAKTEISALFTEWLDKFSERDLAFYERVLDPDWVYVDIFGKVRSKSDYIAYLEHDVPTTVSGRLIELTPRLHGDLALVTGLYTVEGSLADGTDISSTTRFSAVWKHDGGVWRALSHHATTVSEE